jgi:hypothetical protein
MIRSYPWSRYEVQRARPPARRRRLLLLLPLMAFLLYLVLHLVGVDWSNVQTIGLLELAGQRWELYWAPDSVITAFQHHELDTGIVNNLIQIRWR